MPAWLINVIISVGMMVLGYMLAPRPKTEKPELDDWDGPTAEKGRPIPVVFGTVTVKSPNCLWFGDKDIRSREV